MKYGLLSILLLSFTNVNAQKIWDQEAYSKMCKQQLTEVLAHIYELVIDGKLDAYQNDSMVSRIQKAELEERLLAEWVKTFQDWRYPNDPYAFKDTVVSVFYNWETEQMQCLKTPKGEYVIGFKADIIWFYMKLEDILPYLPKEVLPSLELLKKQ
jgi:hypothetical protein